MPTKLKLGVSTFALLTALSAVTGANAQSSGSQGSVAELETVVVTGSSIRGVAPIGSNLVSVGQDAIARTAATNASQLVNTVPAITTAGSAPQGENSYSYYSPQIHSLAGSGSNTTLVIVDGLRMPGGGTQYAQTDPNIIPTSAIQRVEVLADGASSVYGSDAVAGVVNFITRKSFNGLELNGKYGFADSYKTWDIGGIWGTTWDTGGVYIAAQAFHQDPLRDADRDFLSRGDYRAQGGSNNNSFACYPATIRTPSIGNNVFLSPTATTSIANIQDNAPCNNSIYSTSIQGADRQNVLFHVNNTFGDKLTVTAVVNYNHLRNQRENGPGTVNNVTVYGPGSGKAGQINPFFMAPAGDPTATQETISYAALRADGNYGEGRSGNDTFYATSVAEYEINDNFSAKLSNAFGWSRSDQYTRNQFCSACAIMALNGTSQVSGSLTTSAIPGQNVVALNLPLTNANSLDVWRAGGGQTSPEVLRRLYSSNTSTEHYNTFNQTKLEAQGAVFTLPAGEVRMAIGAEYMWSRQEIEGTGTTAVSNTNAAASFTLMHLRRKVYSGYAEVVVPIVSAEMNVPLIRSFDLNLSGRYDNYDDVGETKNPKIAANWEVVQGFRIRGNYATSFVAPPLSAIGDPSLGFQRNANGAAVSGQILVPTAIFPDVKLLPGCATAAATCQIGGALNQGLDRSYGVAALGNPKPQEGNSWSVGVDFAPTFLPGFSSNITYWANKFDGGVTAPSAGQVLNSSALRKQFTLCPTGCTPAQIAAFTNVANGATVTGSLPATVYFLMIRDSGNILNLDVHGIDAMANYRIPTDTLGTFTLGGTLTYFTKYDQDFGDEKFSVLNTSGFNVTFPSIQTKARVNVGWENGPVAFDLFGNYTGSYRNYSNTSIIPVALTASGNPAGSGGDKVDANFTVDMHASYSFTSGLLENSQIYVDVNNLFNEEPPFFNGNTAGIGVGGWGYNGFASNPIGRLTSVGFRAKF